MNRGLKLPAVILAVLLLAFPCFFALAVITTDADLASYTKDYINDSFVPGEVIASLQSLDEAEELAKHYGFELKSYAYGIAVFAAKNPELSVMQSKLRYLSDSVELSLNRLYTTCETDTAFDYDTISPRQSTSSVQYHHKDMDNERAWETATGRGVVIAVIDTGMDLDHDEFLGRISDRSFNSHTIQHGPEYIRDYNGHGTHVSGIIAASGSDGNGISGTAPDSKLMVIKADRPADGKFEMASILRAINYAVENGADIINMSLGTSYSSGAVEAEHSVIKTAVERGVTIVCAAGNDKFGHAGYPAAYPETIAVSALMSGARFDGSYSNYGPEIDISAPGTDIYSTAIGGGYVMMSGTSMASPNIAAVAALIKQMHPDYTPYEVKSVLCETSREAGTLGKDNYYGFGAVSSYAAILGLPSLYNITYNFNKADSTAVAARAAPGSKLLVPYPPERESFIFSGWHISPDAEALFDFEEPVNSDMTLFAHWDELSGDAFSISGVVKSYNPKSAVYLKLVQDGIIKYTTMIASENGHGVRTQTFSFADIIPGVYTLEISKAMHVSSSVHNIIMTGKSIDLTKDPRSNVKTLTLPCGDINGDGEINQTDLNTLWLLGNYNKRAIDSINPNCDLDGDGYINQTDLNILWLPENYNKGAVVIR